MPEPFKLQFNLSIINAMAKHIGDTSQNLEYEFERLAFIEKASENLDALELKARSNQIMNALLEYMPSDFMLALRIIKDALAPVSDDETILFESSGKGLGGWMMMPVTDYIAASALQYNSQYLEEALLALHACTQRFSAEFSIRPFLRDYTTKTLKILSLWAEDENVHVRRLASEGSRPYLPWGLRLHVLAKEPELILPLLETLKNDSSEYVRRSVANNLNDISKDHPDLIAKIATKWWIDGDKNRTKLIRHACRTLLKSGHPEVLVLFGYPPASLSTTDLTLQHKRVRMGGEQNFELLLVNDGSTAQSLLVDYKMYHQKANGKMSPKVFKWTRINLAPNTRKTISKKHSFKAVTTRKYYKGAHKIEILINGKVFCSDSFELC
jgi:3-methyladenine DNA glycosylase AlkC